MNLNKFGQYKDLVKFVAFLAVFAGLVFGMKLVLDNNAKPTLRVISIAIELPAYDDGINSNQIK